MENKRYLLKGPNHLMHLEAILDVFPDASFISHTEDYLRLYHPFAHLLQSLMSNLEEQSMKNGRKGGYFHPITTSD